MKPPSARHPIGTYLENLSQLIAALKDEVRPEVLREEERAALEQIRQVTRHLGLHLTGRCSCPLKG